MNVLLVSQCDKRALVETRRILDQFAERRGDRTWQTPITREGLDTLRRLLRRTARKNTAVACHWIRGIDHSELLWVVGNRSSFNEVGAVATHTTARNVLRAADENQWHYGELLQLLTDLAGLLHDLGKSMDAFQARLRDGGAGGRNAVRHEWVSLRMLQAFVGSREDGEWLERLAGPEGGEPHAWLDGLQRDGIDSDCQRPFEAMRRAPCAQVLGWLVVTHHRLPVLPEARDFASGLLTDGLHHITATWNEARLAVLSEAERASVLAPYWSFSSGLPVTTPEWRQRAARIAIRLQRQVSAGQVRGILDNPFVMHLSRLSLMLADHHYSSLDEAVGMSGRSGRVRIASPVRALAANTLHGQPHQTLDEHLVGVATHGAEVARHLPRLNQHLPGLQRHAMLKARAGDERFRWQDKAFEAATRMREASADGGAFIVNLASTGCGKTLGNARMMYALADPRRGMRCAFAMGLRTLTLQTGAAFEQMLGLDGDDLAIRVGGTATKALFELHAEQAEASGSESRQALLDEDSHVRYDGNADRHPVLRRALADPQVRALIVAPLLVCTIDHLTPATESQRGGRQIAPMLRLLSGDVVLDEPDDFDLDDLPALTRLVHWCGLLGARVLLSSATLPPSLVEGLFEAYRSGRHHHHVNTTARPGSAPPSVCCLWVDEFRQQRSDCDDAQAFRVGHQAFISARIAELETAAAHARRRVLIRPFDRASREAAAARRELADAMLSAAVELHGRHHGVDPITAKRVSFGLVRMANIEPLIDVARTWFATGAPTGHRVHLCVYHARYPLFLRSAIERQLDRTLDRRQPDGVFALPDIRARLDGADEPDQIFLVLGSPVTEVGRDHDYDWAVVEPSSMRSLIQLCGRVRRHRAGSCEVPNVVVLSHNLRHHLQPQRAAFTRPGFERDIGALRLVDHDLRRILEPSEYERIHAGPRISEAIGRPLTPTQRLVDLEHAAVRQTVLPIDTAAAVVPPSGRQARRAAGPRLPTANASAWWSAPPRDVLLTGLLSQHQPFRGHQAPEDVFVLLPDEDASQLRLHIARDIRGSSQRSSMLIDVEAELHVPLGEAAMDGPRVEPWAVSNPLAELGRIADALDMPLRRCAERFAALRLARPRDGEPLRWSSHPTLGFFRAVDGG